MKHLPINNFDLTAVSNAVNQYQSAGLTASYDAATRADGIVALMFSNPVRRDGSVVMFEIHKFQGTGFLFKQNKWVIQLWHLDSVDSEPVRKGCAFGSMLVRALTMAERDVQANFLSLVTFAMAQEAA